MATEAWVCSLTAVADTTGVATQLYPTACTAGVAKATSTNGQLLRKAGSGALHSIQIEPDGVNGGQVQIYDVDGADAGADVSSATAITATQLNALIAAGQAKLIWEQAFAAGAGNGPVTAAGIFRAFTRGLAGRLIGSGTCKLNMVVEGGAFKTESRGGY